MTVTDDVRLQFRSNFTCLRFIPQQAIPSWLTVLLLLDPNIRKAEVAKEKHWATIILPLFLHSIFGFVSIVFILLTWKIVKLKRIRDITTLFSFENIIIAIVAGGIILLYYWGNIFGNVNVLDGGFNTFDIAKYLCFIFFMFLIFSIIVWDENRHNGLFIASNVLLLFLPLFHLGYFNDLVMNACVPAMFIIMIVVLDGIIHSSNDSKKTLLIVLLAIGVLNPLVEIGQIVRATSKSNQKTLYDSNSLISFSDYEDETIRNDLRTNYYTYDVNSDIFVSQIASESMSERIETENVFRIDLKSVDLSNSQLVDNYFGDKQAVLCKGVLKKSAVDSVSTEEYLYFVDYVGFRIKIDDISRYRVIRYSGKKIQDDGEPLVCVYDKSGKMLTQQYINYSMIDDQWRYYFIDVSQLNGEVTLIFNGGYLDWTGSTESSFAFSDIIMY